MSGQGGEEQRPAAVVAVAASAGGVEALTKFVSGLPADFPGAVLVVLHISEQGPSVLPDILRRACALDVVPAVDRVVLRRGLVVVAQPGKHLRVRDGHAVADRGPRENGHRPAADPLFRSVAEAYGKRAAGVVLSGTMDDGAAGLRVVGHAGGLTVVQDPAEAAFPGMPSAAIARAAPALVCPVAAMGEQLSTWMAELGPVDPADPPAAGPGGGTMDAQLSELTCPECGGTLWAEDDLGVEHFRCRVGHSFSTETLLAGKEAAVEAALWAAIVALEERADISRRLLRRVENGRSSARARRYRSAVAQAAGHIDTLHRLVDDLIGQEAHRTDPTTNDRSEDDGADTSC